MVAVPEGRVLGVSYVPPVLAGSPTGVYLAGTANLGKLPSLPIAPALVIKINSIAIPEGLQPARQESAPKAADSLENIRASLPAAQGRGGVAPALNVLNKAFDGAPDDQDRTSGILLHVTSLPSPYGIGDLGPEAHGFVKFLQASGQRYWQTLPLTQTDPGSGNSPYSSDSAFARNTLLISPELLVIDGWLEAKVLHNPVDTPGSVDYGAVTSYKKELFDEVWARYKEHPRQQGEFEAFKKDNSFWLGDYAMFAAIKETLAQPGSWNDWPLPYRRRDPEALRIFAQVNADRIEQIKLLQFIFMEQWDALKAEAHERGVGFIGDMPIYAGYDSADVWAHPEYFQLDAEGKMTNVSGVPPDKFSSTGQRWGTPVYEWNAHQKSGFQWWLERLRHNLKLVDKVRIDHFLGLVRYWSIPAAAKTASPDEGARWEDGPGDGFFAAIHDAFPGALIAEDLGVVTPVVTAVMEKYGFPGMKVLQYAFGNDDMAHNPYLPENHTVQSIVYTGTHDNNTTLGWIADEMGPRERTNLEGYLKGHGIEVPQDLRELAWKVIGLAMRSVARTAIIPMQDVLGLGSEARMNLPGKTYGNWQWRMKRGAADDALVKKLGSRLDI